MAILEIKTLPHLHLHAYLMKKATNSPSSFFHCVPQTTLQENLWDY